ncbi:MAG: CehA/McbA family metallohydrolase, partial [Planctomycetota bacterium]
EYERYSGTFELAASQDKSISVRLKRIADLATRGWYSGDLHVHRPVEDMKLLMRAEDLHVAPVITWWNNRNDWAARELPDDPLVRFDGNRFYRVMAGEDEREGGALMFFGRQRPLAIAGSSREYPSPMKFVEQARSDGASSRNSVWIDIEKPFWWDVPIWLASGQIDSIGLANNHMCRSSVYASEAWGRPRDVKRLAAPLGNGYWTQEIYYHLLNCGLRVPPSAGSASGVLPNPLGYNRVYVHVGKDFSYRKWWEGLRAGRSFVTNGPLLICKANGELPGHIFTAEEGGEIKIDVKVSLRTRDKVPAIEIVKNGRVERGLPPERLPASGSLGTLTFNRSGWFLIRAITDNKRTFRFASTAPYYVEMGPTKRRISRRSAQFFLDWVDQRAKRVKLKLDDPRKLREVLVYHERAREFWRDKVAGANAE